MALALTIPRSAPPRTASRNEARTLRVSTWERLCTPLDLNLAPFRYQHILRKDGGPIEHLEKAQTASSQGLLYTVNAYLAEHLRPSRNAGHRYYGNADGGGTHLTELVARFMAVSEAIERWAFWDRVDSGMQTLYGFDIDPTTTGMAAFPGLFHMRSRRKARLEALERFGLLHWWEGRLRHLVHQLPNVDCQVVEVLVPDSSDAVVVTFRDHPVSGTRAYGYGAGKNLQVAIAAARNEMQRHELVVQRFVERNPDPQLGLSGIDNVQERRALYFALSEGRALFDERLKCGPWARQAAPRTVFDGLLPGDWDRYATVWRALYEPPSDEHLSNRNDYFFW